MGVDWKGVLHIREVDHLISPSIVIDRTQRRGFENAFMFLHL